MNELARPQTYDLSAVNSSTLMILCKIDTLECFLSVAPGTVHYASSKARPVFYLQTSLEACNRSPIRPILAQHPGARQPTKRPHSHRAVTTRTTATASGLLLLQLSAGGGAPGRGAVPGDGSRQRPGAAVKQAGYMYIMYARV